MSETSSSQKEYVQLVRRGDLFVMIPSPEIETLPSFLIEPAAQLILASLREYSVPTIIVDLSKVKYFGSEFITFLLRCQLVICEKEHKENPIVLAGVPLGSPIRELLSLTALNTLWAIYEDTQEAIDALSMD